VHGAEFSTFRARPTGETNFFHSGCRNSNSLAIRQRGFNSGPRVTSFCRKSVFDGFFLVIFAVNTKREIFISKLNNWSFYLACLYTLKAEIFSKMSKNSSKLLFCVLLPLYLELRQFSQSEIDIERNAVRFNKPM
jgi:hypothetical protein